jgi:ABC-2 type transport system ATP-binding protein
VIRLDGVARAYGDLVALDDVSFTVAAGEIVGLLGANGAGKSTLLRTLAGLQAPDRGRVEIDGHDVWGDPVEARRRLGYMAEEPEFYDELSALEYLSFLAGVRGLGADARPRADALLQALGLLGRAAEPVGRYSHGMRKKLSFAAAALHRPAALLCDEALEGFDLEAAMAARETLRSLAAGGTAVLFSTHVAPELERLCDRVVLLHRGRVVRTLTRAEWGGASPGPSPLERAFLDVVRPSRLPESP